MTTRSATGRVGTFSADVTASKTPQEGFGAFRREWEAQTGEAWPLAGLDIAFSSHFRISVRSVHVSDVRISDVYSASYVGRTTADHEGGDTVLLHLMRRGAWGFAPADGRGEAVTVRAGSFIVRDDGPPSVFDVTPRAKATVLILPAPAVAPLLGAGGRPLVGSASSAEARVLMAHAHIVGETARELAPSGVQAARDALLELVEGAMRREFDDAEPRLAPALARAAMAIADSLLTDPELSPTMLARELNVSVRTLHRAFATAGEPTAGYIRRRRLEQARLDLATALRPPGVSEVAARYHFADGSHFIRAFRTRYGQTPAEFARTARGPAGTGTGRAP
jgi:AraC-like DNA-binding protein